jgi:hypothetical protein
MSESSTTSTTANMTAGIPECQPVGDREPAASGPAANAGAAMNDTTSTAGQGRQSRMRKSGRHASAGPIEQAVALRDNLREAVVKANELIRTLKRQRQQNRLVATTLASLKQLQQAS